MRWKYRANQHWLKQGDHNTKFFHLHANQRRKTNHIQHILGPNATVVTDQKAISDIFSSFYSQLFTSSNLSKIDEYKTWNLR